MVDGELYWAYVPAIWEGPEIMVRVNDMRLLDHPSMGRMQEQIEKGINYTGSGIGLPICFSKNETIPSCLNVSRISLSEGARVMHLCAPGGGENVEEALPPPQSLSLCGKKTRQQQNSVLEELLYGQTSQV